MRLVYVWEFPVRLTHWVNFLAIVVLSFTGYYIGRPFFQPPAGEFFYMATVRFVHFVAAYVFTVSVLIRVYWALVGNEYARWREFFPFFGQRRRDLAACAYYYSFIRRECPPAVGHSAMAALSYLVLFLLYLAEIGTGFALYGQAHPGGFLWTLLGGWLLYFFQSPTLRLIHHLIMWAILIFAVIHVYIGWLNDIAEKKFVMSSIFGGYKADEE